MILAQESGRKIARSASTLLVVVAVALLAGCASKKAVAPLSMASTEPMTKGAALAEAQALNSAFKKNPDDVPTALAFARSLQGMGSNKEAVAVLAETATRKPGDKLIMAAYGKSLLSVGQPDKAATVLKRARALDKHDWRVVSALGLAHDQMQRYSEARNFYASAAKLAPGEASIRNNIGLSYALDKDLVSAEKALRTATSMKGAEPRIRQNLALVVGLQGRFEEAKKIASMDLPNAQAEQNTAYLRRMLAEPDAWRQLAEADGDKPALKRPYNNAVADTPKHKPAKNAADGSIGGPLIVIKPSEMEPERVVMSAPLRGSLTAGSLVGRPLDLFNRKPHDKNNEVVVAAKVLGIHRRPKGGGVPE